MVQKLSDAQQAFETLYQTKVRTNAKQCAILAKTQATALSFHISNILQYVNAQAQKEAPFASAVPEINEAIADIMSKARARKTRSVDANAAPAPAPATGKSPAPVAAATVTSSPSATVDSAASGAKVEAKAAA